MAARLSAKRLPRYSEDFKIKAVRLTELPGMEVQAVAEALDIHAVMLSRWRKEAREGRLRGSSPQPRIAKSLIREIRRLQELEKAHQLLKEEHELLKKAIRFSSERRASASHSSKVSEKPSR
jgi:transposase